MPFVLHGLWQRTYISQRLARFSCIRLRELSCGARVDAAVFAGSAVPRFVRGNHCKQLGLEHTSRERIVKPLFRRRDNTSAFCVRLRLDDRRRFATMP